MFARHDSNSRNWHVQMFGEHAPESIIRPAFDWRCSEPHFQRSIVLAFD
jgi:hypothetical protein